MAIGNGSKRKIFASGGFEWLQMISEPDTRGVPMRILAPKGERGLHIGGRVTNGIKARHQRCASEDDRPPRGVDCGIPHRLERRMKHFL